MLKQTILTEISQLKTQLSAQLTKVVSQLKTDFSQLGVQLTKVAESQAGIELHKQQTVSNETSQLATNFSRLKTEILNQFKEGTESDISYYSEPTEYDNKNYDSESNHS